MFLSQPRPLRPTMVEMSLITLACTQTHWRPKSGPPRSVVCNAQYSTFALVISILDIQVSREMMDLAVLNPCALKSTIG